MYKNITGACKLLMHLSKNEVEEDSILEMIEANADILDIQFPEYVEKLNEGIAGLQALLNKKIGVNQSQSEATATCGENTLMTRKKAIEELGCCEKSFYNYTHKARNPLKIHSPNGSNKIYVYQEDLDEFIKNGR